MGDLSLEQVEPTRRPKAPTTVEEQNALVSRRLFLRKSMITAGAATAGLALVTNAFANDSSDSSSNNNSGDLSRQVGQKLFRSILTHEDTHVIFFLNLLGAQARPVPTLRDLEMPTYEQFVLVSRALENTGVGAYGGAAPSIQSPANLAAALSVATVEARHAGVLELITGGTETIGDAPFDNPLFPNEVNERAAPFIASLNGGPPISFEVGVKSPANDIAIANYALALEFLEDAFYTINYVRFFG